jgi:hypothetical protein
VPKLRSSALSARQPEPVNPRPAEAPSPRHDEGMPTEPLDLLEPPVEPGRRWSVILLVLAFAAVATFVFIGGGRIDGPATPGGVETDSGSPAVETPASAGSPSIATTVAPPEVAGCPSVAGPSELQAPRRAAPSVAAPMTADYRFEHSLESAVGTAPDLVEIGRGSSGFTDEGAVRPRDEVLTFGGGRGLSLAPATEVIEGGDYTIELVFRSCRLDGYRKIIDFKSGSSDRGLYSLDGSLDFYPRAPASRTTIDAGAFVEVVLTRDTSSRVVAYLDGIRQFSFLDRGGRALVGEEDTLLFFRDDSTTNGEEFSAGAVSRIRLFEVAISGDEVARLACSELAIQTCR